MAGQHEFLQLLALLKRMRQEDEADVANESGMWLAFQSTAAGSSSVSCHEKAQKIAKYYELARNVSFPKFTKITKITRNNE